MAARMLLAICTHRRESAGLPIRVQVTYVRNAEGQVRLPHHDARVAASIAQGRTRPPRR